MTQPEMTQPVSETGSVPSESSVPPAPPTNGEAAPATEEKTDGEAAPAPAPEPLTPERVSEWNAYYDRYVMGAALLLTLVVACNYVVESTVFLHLKTGQLIGERTAPVTSDEFSYTASGRKWVDVPWLFQWSHAAIYNAVYGAVPVDPMDQTAVRAKAERIAIGALGLLDALVRLATAWILLKIRHRGPGLWWSAICIALALGVFFDPLYGIAPGGLASVRGLGTPPGSITPASWGYLFLALELLIVFRAFDQGRRAWAWWLIPLFALWANWDVSFLTGLLVLAGVVVGHWLDGGAPALEAFPGSDEVGARPDEPGAADAPAAYRPAPVSTGFLVLGLCALACMANPWTYGAYIAAVDPFIRLFQPNENFQIVDTLSFFGRGIQQQLRGAEYLWTRLTAFYLIMVALGLGSFLLNAARFSWRRFLPFAVVSILWACLMRYSAEFALVFAVAIALNGQEWYHGRFGARGRLGRGWTLWSTGGRLVTLTLIFAMVGITITGWHVYKPGIHFGLGYNPDLFPMEAADFLARQNKIEGNVLNTSMAQGNILIWKAYPARKTYVDGRTSLFSQPFLNEWNDLRIALKDDNVETWKPQLDRYNISVVMIEPTESSNTYLKLKDSPNWIPFYDDGRIVMFGRNDAPASDLAVFKENRLEPSRVYHAATPLPASEGPPTATSLIDQIFENRSLDRAQMRTQSAWRWLTSGSTAAAGQPYLPEPARCLLAIQDARIALSREPSDPMAFRILNEAYRVLTLQETALLSGIPLTPDNIPRITALVPSPDRLINRFRQRVTALNYAIQTSPTPSTDSGRDELFELNYQLYELYALANFVDLARDQLTAALAVGPSDAYLEQRRLSRPALQSHLNQLSEAVTEIDNRMSDLEIEQQARAIDQAAFARQQGAVGLAIKRLESAESSGDPVAAVKPQLLDLYCGTGQPDKAQDLLNFGSIGDPNLGSEPGISTYRQGLVYYLLGNYLSTASLWGDQSIPQVRMMRISRALQAGKTLVLGQAAAATDQFLGIPASLEQQASWEFDLAMCELEGGRPDEAAKHFTTALTLHPDLAMRPIAAYYLEQLGKPVPPGRRAGGQSKPLAGDTKPSGAKVTPAGAPPAPTSTEPQKAPAPRTEPAKGAGDAGAAKKAETTKSAP
jgi:tetratricopeptide (TPR) repeat protein